MIQYTFFDCPAVEHSVRYHIWATGNTMLNHRCRLTLLLSRCWTKEEGRCWCDITSMLCAVFVVPFTDTEQEDAEPFHEWQHQESGTRIQLYREAAGWLGVHLHDPGQFLFSKQGTYYIYTVAVTVGCPTVGHVSFAWVSATCAHHMTAWWK